eukprot:TRINITY_DN19910_c0_g1_i1.p2 TRINITY_DN19910_c0_g1~~TRINITY_DN19910_c0_g1_i1.p2  ORF type:complete len:129 (+),score=26.66 TRINITY_DN19910_c0_g1_i1:143-529(+)
MVWSAVFHGVMGDRCFQANDRTKLGPMARQMSCHQQDGAFRYKMTRGPLHRPGDPIGYCKSASCADKAGVLSGQSAGVVAMGHRSVARRAADAAASGELAAAAQPAPAPTAAAAAAAAAAPSPPSAAT